MNETLSAPSLDGILTRIRYRPTGFNPVEGRIATAILEDPRRVCRESIIDFARRTTVSTGSVVRFSKLLGFSGFHDLKLAIAESGAEAAPAIEEVHRSRFHRYMEEQMKSMLFAADQVDPMAIEMAASALARARRIDLAATGASAVVSQTLLWSLTLLGLHVRFLPDSAEQGAAAGFIGPGDVLVAVSFSGRTRATVDAAARAAKAGATVVALTCNRRGPILRHTSIAILLDARQARVDSEWPMRTAMLAVARSLSMYVADEFSQDELGSRRSTWASARFGMRYDDN
jgi:DNA-binding MurR/RpiR family transcriptional regulator